MVILRMYQDTIIYRNQKLHASNAIYSIRAQLIASETKEARHYFEKNLKSPARISMVFPCISNRKLSVSPESSNLLIFQLKSAHTHICCGVKSFICGNCLAIPTKIPKSLPLSLFLTVQPKISHELHHFT